MKVLALSLLLASAAHATEGRASPAKVSRGLIVGQAISLGLLYLGNVGTAAVSAIVASSAPVVPAQTSSLNALFIPIAGPFIALGDPRNHTPLMVFALVLDAVAYVTSLTVLTVAIVIGSSSKLSPSAWLSPGAAGSAGATLTLRLP